MKHLEGWLEEVKGRFTLRDLRYQSVHHARIQLQLKDMETGRIELHDLRFSAKGAPEFEFQDA